MDKSGEKSKKSEKTDDESRRKVCFVFDCTRQIRMTCVALSLKQLKRKGCQVLGYDRKKLGREGWRSVRVVFEDCGVEVKSEAVFEVLQSCLVYMFLAHGEKWQEEKDDEILRYKEEEATLLHLQESLVGHATNACPSVGQNGAPLAISPTLIRSTFVELCKDKDRERIRRALLQLKTDVLKEIMQLDFEELKKEFDGHTVMFVESETFFLLEKIEAVDIAHQAYLQTQRRAA